RKSRKKGAKDLSKIIVSSGGHERNSPTCIRKITQYFLNSIIDPLDSPNSQTKPSKPQEHQQG
uniref:Uncharacterized protein n=1 Tax=Oryza brachyantha TaxID=4533 RepID=J3N3U3_ORYBR